MDNDRQTTAENSAVNAPTSVASLGPDWETEDAYWQSAYPERPYARADRSYEYYRSAYRYGTERATQWQGREWADAERDLSDAWPTIGDATSLTWDDVRDAVRDAWDRVRGESEDDRTHIR
ncbi:MAG TPA: hypothetical protein VFW03_20745 [Gemmatimonadaceae bacterium]|nr:hypothetical protein [Gemmatimonadaceae bacterium]